jgi:hypothetical protein
MTMLRVLQAVVAIAGALLAATPAPAQHQHDSPKQSQSQNRQAAWVTFGPGMEVRLPPAYWGRTNRETRKLAVLSRDRAGVQFTLEARDAGAARRSGEAAVRALAKKKNLKLHNSGDKLVLMEPRTEGTLDGRESRNLQIHIGFERFVVLMSLNVYEDKKDSQAVQQFFDTDMEEILQSIRKKKEG